MRNTAFSSNETVERALELLRDRLPTGWRVRRLDDDVGAYNRADVHVEIRSPDRRACNVTIEAKARLEPKAAVALLPHVQRNTDGVTIVVAPFLSPMARERLAAGNVSYLDLTGNARVVVSDPGLFIVAEGARAEPNASGPRRTSLRGSKAGRLVRALIDFRPPLGVRDLAEKAKVDAGYTSRLLSFFDQESLIRRDDRGRVSDTDWQALLRRWGAAAPLASRGAITRWIAPRGIDALLAQLRKLSVDDATYAVTGPLGASLYEPVSSARLAVIYTRRPTPVAHTLGLHPADAGANALLIDPTDPGVFARRAQIERVWYAAPSQIAADLMTSPGRGPADAEALIHWMAKTEEAWRA